tara:strand:+ start:110 stop:727 length:618 start_codon:yes stop_codon:yes gene_type:complete
MNNRISKDKQKSGTNKKSLKEIKSICKDQGINNTIDYKRRYRDIRGLPAHPERIFSDEWKGYPEFFDMPQLQPYEQLKKEVQQSGIKSKSQYQSWISSKNDNNYYPRHPEEVYKDEWENWYDFCGKDKPFKPDYIPIPFKEWGEKINEFMKQAQGGGSKITHLCRFVRIYIEVYDKSRSPLEFLTKERVNIRPFREELKKLGIRI